MSSSSPWHVVRDTASMSSGGPPSGVPWGTTATQTHYRHAAQAQARLFGGSSHDDRGLLTASLASTPMPSHLRAVSTSYPVSTSPSSFVGRPSTSQQGSHDTHAPFGHPPRAPGGGFFVTWKQVAILLGFVVMGLTLLLAEKRGTGGAGAGVGGRAHDAIGPSSTQETSVDKVDVDVDVDATEAREGAPAIGGGERSSSGGWEEEEERGGSATGGETDEDGPGKKLEPPAPASDDGAVAVRSAAEEGAADDGGDEGGEATTSTFRAFFTFFENAGLDARDDIGAFKAVHDDFYDFLKISAAASRHFGAPVDLVTTGDDASIREALADHERFGHVNVVNYPLGCGGDAAEDFAPQFRCPVSFVDTFEQLKWAHISRHVGESLVYFEADMVTMPGAGAAVREALATGEFDVGFTYNPSRIQKWYDERCGEVCGTINSGFILWKRVSQASLDFMTDVIAADYEILGDGERFNGGENQHAVDMVVKRTSVPVGDVVRVPVRGGSAVAAGKEVRVMSLPWDRFNYIFSPETGDDNYPDTACCAMKDTPILHFYSGHKRHMVGKCCRDLAFGVDGGDDAATDTRVGIVGAAPDPAQTASGQQHQRQQEEQEEGMGGGVSQEEQEEGMGGRVGVDTVTPEGWSEMGRAAAAVVAAAAGEHGGAKEELVRDSSLDEGTVFTEKSSGKKRSARSWSKTTGKSARKSSTKTSSSKSASKTMGKVSSSKSSAKKEKDSSGWRTKRQSEARST